MNRAPTLGNGERQLWNDALIIIIQGRQMPVGILGECLLIITSGACIHLIPPLSNDMER